MSWNTTTAHHHQNDELDGLGGSDVHFAVATDITHALQAVYPQLVTNPSAKVAPVDNRTRIFWDAASLGSDSPLETFQQMKTALIDGGVIDATEAVDARVFCCARKIQKLREDLRNSSCDVIDVSRSKMAPAVMRRAAQTLVAEGGPLVKRSVVLVAARPRVEVIYGELIADGHQSWILQTSDSHEESADEEEEEPQQQQQKQQRPAFPPVSEALEAAASKTNNTKQQQQKPAALSSNPGSAGPTSPTTNSNTPSSTTAKPKPASVIVENRKVDTVKLLDNEGLRVLCKKRDSGSLCKAKNHKGLEEYLKCQYIHYIDSLPRDVRAALNENTNNSASNNKAASTPTNVTSPVVNDKSNASTPLKRGYAEAAASAPATKTTTTTPSSPTTTSGMGSKQASSSFFAKNSLSASSTVNINGQPVLVAELMENPGLQWAVEAGHGRYCKGAPLCSDPMKCDFLHRPGDKASSAPSSGKEGGKGDKKGGGNHAEPKLTEAEKWDPKRTFTIENEEVRLEQLEPSAGLDYAVDHPWAKLKWCYGHPSHIPMKECTYMHRKPGKAGKGKK